MNLLLFTKEKLKTHTEKKYRFTSISLGGLFVYVQAHKDVERTTNDYELLRSRLIKMLSPYSITLVLVMPDFGSKPSLMTNFMLLPKHLK